MGLPNPLTMVPESVALSGLSYGGMSVVDHLQAVTRLASRGCCDNGWDFCGNLFQFFHRQRHMVTGKMRMPHSRADLPMPELFFRRGQLYPGHCETPRERITGIMKLKSTISAFRTAGANTEPKKR
jgi:hypothetical protein